MTAFILAAGLAALAIYYMTRVPAANTVDVFQADERLAKVPGIQLIDVRTRMEFDEGHLKGAKLMPVQDFGSRISEIDKARPVLVYCRSGHRSAVAMQALLKQGFDAVHMEGGIMAWQAAGKPVV